MRRFCIGLAIVAALLLASAIAWNVLGLGIAANGNITKAINNVRQIYFGLGLYANDNEGRFPDGATANAALRELVMQGFIEREQIFGCPNTVFVPDGKLGEAPQIFARSFPLGCLAESG